MKLADTIENVIRLSESMQEAIERDSIEEALDFLELRGRAMEEFVSANREAPDLEREACRDGLTRLKLVDDDLQEAATLRLQGLGREMRSHMGNHRAEREETACLTGCLDRRA